MPNSLNNDISKYVRFIKVKDNDIIGIAVTTFISDKGSLLLIYDDPKTKEKNSPFTDEYYEYYCSLKDKFHLLSSELNRGNSKNFLI